MQRVERVGRKVEGVQVAHVDGQGRVVVGAVAAQLTGEAAAQVLRLHVLLQVALDGRLEAAVLAIVAGRLVDRLHVLLQIVFPHCPEAAVLAVVRHPCVLALHVLGDVALL